MTPEPPLRNDWLLRLRTTAVLGIGLTVLAVDRFMAVELPLGPLLVVLGTWLATNVAAAVWERRREEGLGRTAIFGLMALDAVFLTVVFYFTGGPSNPFGFLYLVHISLGAMVLQPRQAWALAGLAVSLSGLLFFAHVPLPPAAGGHGHGHDAGSMVTHLRGMWAGLAVAAAFIVTSVGRVTRALAQRERDLAEARTQAARAGRLASLATLAAGAAHELATPLSTIAVVANDLVDQLADDAATAEDLRLIQEQVARCRTILADLRADAGDPGGEAPSTMTVADVVDLAVSRLPDTSRVRVAVEERVAATSLSVYPRALARALRGLVKNGLDATEADGQVVVDATLDADRVLVRVVDDGHGMDPDTLARVGEPFFTTKPTGRGMGLGVFLASAVAERHGGCLSLEATPGGGTTATLTLALGDAR